MTHLPKTIPAIFYIYRVVSVAILAQAFFCQQIWRVAKWVLLWQMAPCRAADVEALVHTLCTASPSSTEAVVEQVMAWVEEVTSRSRVDDTGPEDEPPAEEDQADVQTGTADGPSAASQGQEQQDPLVGPRDAVYCVTRGPRARHGDLGIWIGLWNQLRSRLEFTDLCGSGFHIKRCNSVEDARAYWAADRRVGLPQVRKL